MRPGARPARLIVTAFFLANLLGPSLRAQPPIDVWLDVDTANGVGDVDDGLMMIQAFHAPQIHVRGVSVQFGNSTLDRAAPIAEHIVERFGPQGMTVHRGAASAADFGRETDAVRAMALALQEKPMAIAAVGPVTNVATLLNLHPELHRRITQIIVVAARRPGQKFILSEQQQAPFRDANFEKDVPAMAALLASNIPLVFAPWEVSSTVWLTPNDLAMLHQTGGAGAWIAATSQDWADRWHQILGTDGFTPFDTLAIGYLTHPNLIESMPVSVSITMDKDDGALPVDRSVGQLKPYLLVVPTAPNQARAIYTYHAQPSFKDALLKQLSAVPRDQYAPAGQHADAFDHALLDLVLRTFVDAQGLVDYPALRDHMQTLNAYLQQLAQADLNTLSRDETLALLLNAYNAFTLKLIVEHPAITSIKDIPKNQRWEPVRWKLGGQRVSLNQIEHDMIRPVFGEPRIHWALVCAARGCPPLRQHAYTAAKLEHQLADQAHRIHHHQRYLRFDPSSNRLGLTPLYKWYHSDFGQGNPQQVIIAAAAQQNDQVAQAVTRHAPIKTWWLAYDWQLNTQAIAPSPSK